MTDERLRDLGRRCNESGSSEDMAVWLLERVRSGSLSEDQVRLAAYLGDPAAAMVTPHSPTILALAQATEQALRDRPEGVSILDFEPGWGLAPWGDEPVLRYCLAAAHALLSEFEVESDPDSRALEAAEEMLVLGVDQLRADRLARLDRDLNDYAEDHGRWPSFVQAVAHHLAVNVIVYLTDSFDVHRAIWDWPPEDETDVTSYMRDSFVSADQILEVLLEFADEPGDEIAS